MDFTLYWMFYRPQRKRSLSDYMLVSPFRKNRYCGEQKSFAHQQYPVIVLMASLGNSDLQVECFTPTPEVSDLGQTQRGRREAEP